LLLVTLVVSVYSQSNQDCNAFVFPNYIIPDHGTFGSCAGTIPHLGSCNFDCESNSVGSWTLVGNPFTCNNNVISGGPQYCRFNNYVWPAQNCSVTNWGTRSTTDCSSMCGGGSYTWTRQVQSYGEPGGEPCPVLSVTVPCGDKWCHDNIVDEGYYHWGPFCAGQTQRIVTYYVNTFGQNIDLYVFDQANFNRYTWDAALSTPQNAYYYPVTAYLNTYFEHDSFVVPPGQCYHLVLDNSNVGPTKGNGQNGAFTNIYFEFAISGVTAADGFSDFSYQRGLYQPAAAVRSSSISFFGIFLTAIVLLVLKLE